LVSDKIEGVDSKREVVHLHFSCRMKKTEIGLGLPLWAAIAGLESLIAGHGESAGEGVEGEERRGAGGATGCVGGGGAMGSSCIGEGTRPFTPCFGSVCPNCCVRKKTTGRKEKRREGKEKKGRKKEKEKYGKTFQTWKFLEKIKDNL
jgi:hypothetical protein